MTTNTRTTIGFTFGTLCFMGLLAGLAIMTICGTLIVTQTSPDRPQVRRPVVRPLNLPPRLGEIGDMKEAELNRQYGAVNSSKLNEVKEGLFSRMRARRQASNYQSQCQPGWQSYSSLPAYTAPVYHRVTLRSSCSSCPTVSQPVLTVEQPMPKIDPGSCYGGSCELESTPASSSVTLPDCVNCNQQPSTAPSIYGT